MSAKGWSQAEIDQAVERIGVTVADLNRACRAASIEQARAQLATLKVDAKSRYRKWARQLHPDRTGGDSDLMRQFQVLSTVWKELDGIEIQSGPRRPPPPPRPAPRRTVIVVRGGWAGAATTGTTSTTSSATTFNGWF